MTRILIVGAGATGGALGARLLDAGEDVTFLVRERRAAELRENGLRFRAPDTATRHRVRAVTDPADSAPFDLVVLAVKAPALPAIIPALKPAVGPGTRLLPLLNGMAHLEALEDAFPGQVLGGLVKIVATLDEDSTVVQMTELSTLSIGDPRGGTVPEQIVRALDAAGIGLQVADDITARLWEKWVFIAAAGVITCLFRGTVGDILAAGGETSILDAIDECEHVAAASGHPVSGPGHAQSLALLTEPGSGFTSSLYRDLEHGDPLEAEHILGDLAARASTLGVSAPLLDAALLQLRTHHRAAARAHASAQEASA